MIKNSLPRGIRNNNPANIVRSGVKWIGLSKVQSDSCFCQFDDMKYGVRAFFVLARTYRKKYGIKTVRSFIERFAPYSDNDVDSYVDYILSNYDLPHGILSSDLDYVRLLYWIIRFENHLSHSDMCYYHLLIMDLYDICKSFNIKIV